MFNYDEYLEERVDEIFFSKDHQDFVQDMMINHWVDYTMSALDTVEKREAAYEDVAERTKRDIADHYGDMIEAEYDELQAEYRADMAIDRMKEEAMIGC